MHMELRSNLGSVCICLYAQLTASRKKGREEARYHNGSALRPKSCINATVEVVLKDAGFHLSCNLLQRVHVPRPEALLHCLGQALEDLHGIEATGAHSLFRRHGIHSLDQRDRLELLLLVIRDHLLLLLLLLLLIDGSLDQLFDEMVHPLLEGGLGLIPLKLLKKTRHQVSRRALHGLCQLVNLRDDLSLLRKLDHPLSVALHLFLQCCQHEVVVCIVIHEDIAAPQQHIPRLFP
mmetsp:Transcript_22520/g.49756  ORF Transcript_22520/g.49756 Transcript_22520/m.49756 type:complete len:235 (+) Transcript_22520:38-742(+)